SITAKAVGLADEEYSKTRLEALRDEWRADLPNLADMVLALKVLSCEFRCSEGMPDLMVGIMQFLALEEPKITFQDPTREDFETLFNSDNEEELYSEFMSLMHRVGVIGVKTSPTQPTSWVYQGSRVKRMSTKDKFEIHPS